VRGDVQAELGRDLTDGAVLGLGEQGDGEVGEEQEPGGLPPGSR
jgi:hypothetical protein